MAYTKKTVLTFNGKSQTLEEWAFELHLDTTTLWARLCRGWPVEKVLQPGKFTANYLEYKGKRQSMSQWAKETGMNVHTIAQRIRNGWTVEQALETPLVPPKERRADNKNNQ